MKIKKLILPLLLLLALSFTMSSCSSDDIVFGSEGGARDPHVYAFKLSAKPISSKDTVAYSRLANTQFVVDQKKGEIYNPDSLHFETRMGKFLPKFVFSAKGNPSKVSVIYNDNTTEPWNGSDSIDFRKATGFEIIAQDGITEMRYDVELRVHNLDPEAMQWLHLGAQDFTVKDQKTVYKDKIFHSFYVYGNKVCISTFNKKRWSARIETQLPLNMDIRSICIFENKFYGKADDGKAYSSDDGQIWAEVTNNQGILTLSVLGTLPGETETDEDYLLTVITEDGALNKNSKYKYAKTKDMKNFVFAKVNGAAIGNESTVNPSYMYQKSTPAIKRDGNNMLLLTGGVKAFEKEIDEQGNKNKEALTNKTFSIRNKGDLIEVTSTAMTANDVLITQVNLPTFYYDNKLYAFDKDIIAISESMGGRWFLAPKEQTLHDSMQKMEGESIIVDEENYIWVFGENQQQKTAAWRGRLNRLIPK